MNQYLLIKQGNIHNAVEKEPYTADILIENGKIKKIAPVLEGAIINDAEIIDASGLEVYPGFVATPWSMPGMILMKSETQSHRSFQQSTPLIHRIGHLNWQGQVA